MEVNMTRWVLTAPADRAVFDRIELTYADLDGFIERLRGKKIDVQHFVATRKTLTEHENVAKDFLTDLKWASLVASHHMTLRTHRIYFRALLLALLDEEDQWAPPKKSH